jgi:hypothetical protein
MGVEVVTKEDLQAFRQQLLNDLKTLLSFKTSENNEWLRSSEVRKLLKISPGTLQNLRITGRLKPVKIGGIFFYKSTDIDNLLKTGE